MYLVMNIIRIAAITGRAAITSAVHMCKIDRAKPGLTDCSNPHVHPPAHLAVDIRRTGLANICIWAWSMVHVSCFVSYVQEPDVAVCDSDHVARQQLCCNR